MPRNGHSKKARPSIDAVQDDLQSLRDDVTQLSTQLQGLLSNAGTEVVDDVMARLNRARSTVDALIVEAGHRGKEAARAVVDIKENIVEGVEESVRERPIMALAIAVGFGFILSSTMRR
jgi:ElaB/YqjD/DUF883 family membrane-anchored ribosome-binding protein